jgi:uncharacterized RmlC-like cupin family protein
MRRVALALIPAIALTGPAFAGQEIIGAKDGTDVVTVRNVEEKGSKQALPNFPGISGKTAGARHLTMLKVVIPPGVSGRAHIHKGYESAVYLLKGRVETRYGEGLKKSVVNVAGDYIFIPADVPHQPRNLSKTEEAVAIVVRNDPDEQNHVVLYSWDRKK